MNSEWINGSVNGKTKLGAGIYNTMLKAPKYGAIAGLASGLGIGAISNNNHPIAQSLGLGLLGTVAGGIAGAPIKALTKTYGRI